MRNYDTDKDKWMEAEKNILKFTWKVSRLVPNNMYVQTGAVQSAAYVIRHSDLLTNVFV